MSEVFRRQNSGANGHFALGEAKAPRAIDVVSGLFDGAVLVLSAQNSLAHFAALTDREAALVVGAVDKRKQEFATGRFLARRALEQLGYREVEILRGVEREPLWPAGICGSISHCDTRAVVAVANAATGSVGIDIEHRAELEPRLWRSVLLPEEIRELERTCEADRARRALLCFSAKEAFYKAQYPLSRQFLDFHAVRVSFGPAVLSEESGAFECALSVALAPFAPQTVVQGRYRLGCFPTGEQVTAVHIRERSSGPGG